MQKGINLLINNIKRDLLEVLGRDQLPMSVIALITNELNIQVGKQLEQALITENKDYEEGIQKEIEEKGKKPESNMHK